MDDLAKFQDLGNIQQIWFHRETGEAIGNSVSFDIPSRCGWARRVDGKWVEMTAEEVDRYGRLALAEINNQENSADVRRLMDSIQALALDVKIIKSNQEKIMSALTNLQAAVANETTVDQSAVTLIQGIAAQLAALAASANNGSVAASDVEALVTQINQNASGLAAAVTSNTPTPATPAAA